LPGAAAGLGATVAALALGAAYVKQTAADARAWDTAAADQRQLLAGLHSALPRLPQAAIVYAFDAPQTVGPGIPVLNTAIDLTSAMRISYSSPTLVGVPVAAAASVMCGPRGTLAGGVGGAYGQAYLVDVGARRAVRLIGRAQCALRTARSMSASPLATPSPLNRPADHVLGPGDRPALSI